MNKIDPGIRKIVQQKVDDRKTWLDSLEPGRSRVNILVRKGGTRLTGVYKCHSDSTITVQFHKTVLDCLIRGAPRVGTMDYTTEDMTFNFLEVEMKNA